jgi:hypothetical protein
MILIALIVFSMFGQECLTLGVCCAGVDVTLLHFTAHYNAVSYNSCYMHFYAWYWLCCRGFMPLGTSSLLISMLRRNDSLLRVT